MSIRSASSAKELGSHAMLSKTLDILKAGDERKGLEHVRQLEKSYPEIVKKIFGHIWHLEGERLVKTGKQANHAQFGRLAFYGKEGRSVSSATRIKAIETVRARCIKPRKVPCIKPYFLDKDFKGNQQALLNRAWADTLSILQARGYTTYKGKRVSINTSTSVKKTVAYKDAGKKSIPKTGKKQEIVIWEQDCLYAAEKYARKGKRVAVLNMAADTIPGGCVRKAGKAQEEQLSRRTGLIDAIASPRLQGKQKNYYPLSKKVGPIAAGLFSPQVPVFRHGAEKGYAVLENPFVVDMLTVAAYNKPRVLEGRIQKKEIIDGTKEKIRTILEMAYQNRDEVVILSALGCGAFDNPPAHIAELFQEVIEKSYPGAFETIAFAIINDSRAPKGGNFLPFAKCFGERGAKVFDSKGKEMSVQ